MKPSRILFPAAAMALAATVFAADARSEAAVINESCQQEAWSGGTSFYPVMDGYAKLEAQLNEWAQFRIEDLEGLSDGLRILRMIIQSIKQERPLQFFCGCGALMLLLGTGLGTPVIVEFVHTGLVPRLPTAVLATGCVLIAFMFFTAGLILDAVAHARVEMKRLSYLAMAPLDFEPAQAGLSGREQFGEPGLLPVIRDQG